MKKVLLFLLCITFLSSYSQEPSKSAKKPKPGLASGLVLFNDFWREDIKNMSPRTINQGMDFYVTYNVPVEKTPLSFSIGTGLGVHNLYSNAVLVQDNQSGNYTFVKISDLDSTKNLSYKKSKISVAYWDFPMEFRFRDKGGFTLAVGMKFGMNINAMTKYKGDDYTGLTNDKIKMKIKDLDNILKWRYGFTARMGFKMVELYYFYSLTNVFTKGKGPEIAPMSIGISVRPLFMEGKK
jgi:hypothetical protein